VLAPSRGSLKVGKIPAFLYLYAESGICRERITLAFMDYSNIKDRRVENQLFYVLKLYFYSTLNGNYEDSQKWFQAIGKATEGWKMMSNERTAKINKDFDVPEWFMWAIHATQ
jgi:hypothetical protein